LLAERSGAAFDQRGALRAVPSMSSPSLMTIFLVIARSEADEAIQSFLLLLDCFAEPVIGRAFARPVGSQ
jgi:hypothetical protein